MGDEQQGNESGEEGTPSTAEAPRDGIVSIRDALVGLGFIWLTAMAAVGAMGAVAYGVTESANYLLAAVLAGGIAVAAGSKSLRVFGYR